MICGLLGTTIMREQQWQRQRSVWWCVRQCGWCSGARLTCRKAAAAPHDLPYFRPQHAHTCATCPRPPCPHIQRPVVLISTGHTAVAHAGSPDAGFRPLQAPPSLLVARVLCPAWPCHHDRLRQLTLVWPLRRASRSYWRQNVNPSLSSPLY